VVGGGDADAEWMQDDGISEDAEKQTPTSVSWRVKMVGIDGPFPDSLFLGWRMEMVRVVGNLSDMLMQLIANPRELELAKADRRSLRRD
jgi:hypothetical protein